MQADSVVLAVGHYDLQLTDAQLALASAGKANALNYFPAAAASEIDLNGIRPGEPVILFGMGLAFFDCVSRLTEERGGRFVPGVDELTYIPSGNEPQIIAASRLGIPHRAGASTQSERPLRHELRYFTTTFADEILDSTKRGNLEFRRDVWPTLRKELTWAFYSSQAKTDSELQALGSGFDSIESNLDDLLGVARECLSGPIELLDWQDLLDPLSGQHFKTVAQFDEWVLMFLRADLRRLKSGRGLDPLKALSVAVRECRRIVRSIVSFGGLTAGSYVSDLQGWYNGVNNRLGSGPPASRIQELVALTKVGLVEYAGPGSQIAVDPVAKAFVVESKSVSGSRRQASTLIECFLPEADVRKAADPLLRQMLDDGICRPFRMATEDGLGWDCGAVEVEKGTLRVVGARGHVEENIYCFGPPLEGIEWVTASSARPGVASPLLLQAELIVSQLLARSSLRGGRESTTDMPHLGATDAPARSLFVEKS